MLDLTSFAQYLQTQGYGTIGTNIFVNAMPADKTGILLLNDVWGIVYDPYLPGYYKGSFFAVVRGKNTQTVSDTAEGLFETLKFEQQKIMGNVKVNFCYPHYTPIIYQRSDGGLMEASIKYDINYITI
jgi:hypothetical protein